jgi:hypothetical protein
MQITHKEWLAQNGNSSAEEALAEYREHDDVYPALYTRGGQVLTLSARSPVPAAGAQFDLKRKETLWHKDFR